MVKDQLTTEQIKSILYAVKDPEIPTISVVDLGVISEIDIRADGSVFVEMIPTFSGCPALEFMRLNIEAALHDAGIKDFEVKSNRNKQWTSDNVTELGRKQLLEHGLSPPPKTGGSLETDLENAQCPNCGSTNTTLKNPFGPTLCRAIHHCNDCRETFEQFKPV